VFPAVRALPEAMRAELLLAMRGRREGSATD
jgi:hypothetical protein